MTSLYRDHYGDFRAGLDVEHSEQPLYSRQHEIPRLPVPALEDTCKLYLETLVPLLSVEEHKRSTAAVQEFLKKGGIGETLQARLIARSEDRSNSSWLIEWWNQLGYLLFREPVVINVSYFFHFEDDRVARRSTQVGRAAALTAAVLMFRNSVASGTLPTETLGRKKKPLCSSQYKYMFNSCRIPDCPSDFVRTYDPAVHSHVAVMRHNRLFTFASAHPDGTPLAVHEIECQLARIVEAAGQRHAPAVGALTTESRDTWAASRLTLLSDDGSVSSGNAVALERLQSACFLLCLDTCRPVTRGEVARALWHGDGNDRWFDKALQLVVFANGKAGVVGEHSLFDGMPTVRLVNTVLAAVNAGQTDATTAALSTPRSCPALPPPQPLPLSLSAASLENVASALRNFNDLVSRHHASVLAFTGFGGSAIKRWKMSPDAFMQMAIQLAYHKTFGVCRPTYESTQTRSFLHGRTEVTRSVSRQSLQFCEAMAQPLSQSTGDAAGGMSADDAISRHKLLLAAAKQHVKYVRAAASGRGVDRHLLGLRLLLTAQEKAAGGAAIFNDPAYARSGHWNVSTSQLVSEGVDGWGWGEVVPDGVGIAYDIKARSLHFNVAACQPDWCPRMVHHLQEALLQMREVCELASAAAAASAAPAATPTSAPLQKPRARL